MTGITKLSFTCAALLLLASAICGATVYPTVDFNFNPNTYEYSWTVNYTSAVDVNFTTLLVYSSIPMDCWTSVTGAWSGSPLQDEAWTFTSPPNNDGTAELRWYAPAGQNRTVAKGPWTGVFKVVIPNSTPVAGNLRTYAYSNIYLTQSTFVPSIVPEPSGLLALGSAFALVPILFRKRK